MNNLRQAAQQALEALNRSDYLGWQLNIPIIKNLKAALAEPQMQPCAGRNCGSTNPNLHSAECFEDYEKSTGMNQWQGLTDEERNNLWRNIIGWGDPSHDDEDLMKAIEAKLKEKNT